MKPSMNPNSPCTPSFVRYSLALWRAFIRPLKRPTLLLHHWCIPHHVIGDLSKYKAG